MVDLDCGKRIIFGDPVTGLCSSTQEENAGLCYKKCKEGYTGVGPVCWMDAPKSWVECGMGAAKDEKVLRPSHARARLRSSAACLSTSSCAHSR